MPSVYNLFISHSWSYGYAYEKLVAMLKEKSYFNFKNYSVPKNNPIHNAPNAQELYNAIKNQMSNCHVIIVMAGKYSTYSAWINKEIKIAKQEFYSPKPIVAVKPWGAQQISTIVRDAANVETGWNSSSIVDAIRSLT